MAAGSGGGRLMRNGSEGCTILEVGRGGQSTPQLGQRTDRGNAREQPPSPSQRHQGHVCPQETPASRSDLERYLLGTVAAKPRLPPAQASMHLGPAGEAPSKVADALPAFAGAPSTLRAWLPQAGLSFLGHSPHVRTRLGSRGGVAVAGTHISGCLGTGSREEGVAAQVAVTLRPPAAPACAGPGAG